MWCKIFTLLFRIYTMQSEITWSLYFSTIQGFETLTCVEVYLLKGLKPWSSLFLLFRLIFSPPCTDIWKWLADVLGEGNLSLEGRKREPKEEEKLADKNFTFSRPFCLWWKIFRNKIQRQNVHCEMHVFRSNHIYGALFL